MVTMPGRSPLALFALALLLCLGQACERSGNVGTRHRGDGSSGYDGTTQCPYNSCSALPAGGCTCTWSCTDGKTYGLECQMQGATQHCRCKVNGVFDNQTCANPASLNICLPDRCCNSFPKP
jgi:hypothetical protein